MAKYLIVGGVAGGATAAARLRRLDETAEIVLLERGAHVSYANCGLPYYIGGVITERERLFVQTPEGFRTRFKVDVRVNSEAAAIDRAAKTVTVRDLARGTEYTERYDKLVLSPGAEPIRPPIPGIDEDGIFTLRNVPDTDRISEFVETRRPRRAVVVGAGFIGLETAENLHHRGVAVTVVEAADQVMAVIDPEMAAEVHRHLASKNVALYLSDGVSSFSRHGELLTVTLGSGRALEADLVVLAIGVRPETALARNAGLTIGKTGGITVDRHLKTSDPAIYALGDAIEFPSPVIGRPLVIPLAGPANKQGRIVADNIVFGDTESYAGSIGTSVAKVFDLTVASTGVSEKLLVRESIPYRTVITHSGSHAGYYPDAVPMSVKTIFAPDTGRVLGAQIVGYDGVDKRIDLFAAVLRAGGTVYDLSELEHAYAPPFSSAKDPVNIAGFAARNLLEGLSENIAWNRLSSIEAQGGLIVDVRTPEEHELGTIPGAKNIPLDELRSRLAEVPKNVPVTVFCRVGLRAYLAERILRGHGYANVKNLSGGYTTWSAATGPQGNDGCGGRPRSAGAQSAAHTEAAEGFAAAGRPPVPDGGVPGNGAANHRSALAVLEHLDTAVTPAAPAASGEPKTVRVDACGLQCPGPIMRLKKEIDRLGPGERILQTTTDPGFAKDVGSWCAMTGNTLLELSNEGSKVTALVEKGLPREAPTKEAARNRVSEEATVVVFSDSMDRALASFVIANGAASSGKKVTMFFTFWGLSVIKKPRAPKAGTDFMGRMFGMMLPKSSAALGLSKMNMGGLGSFMMRLRMKTKKIESLEAMIENAREAGIRLVACQMSMDVMGVRQEQLMDGVEIGGVATYLEAAGRGGVNLFV